MPPRGTRPHENGWAHGSFCRRSIFRGTLEVSPMPLHDWTDDRGWDSVHHYWITNLSLWLKPRPPSGFRAYLGSVPGLTIETGVGRPDVAVRHWRPETPASASAAAPTAMA